MFIFKSKRKVLVENAQNVARLAHKVVCYRKDILPQSVVSEIETLQEALLAVCKDKSATDDTIEAKMEALHHVIEKHGGDIYPVTFWSEHIEMLLVAAILAIGIRTFFFQPFKIPTNSMYPTYNGMTYEVFNTPEEVPSFPQEIFRKVTLFTKNKHLQATQDGQLSILVKQNMRSTAMSFHSYLVPSRKFFVWPSKSMRVMFLVNGEPHPIDVPAEFSQIHKIINHVYTADSSQRKPFSLSQEQRIAQGVGSDEAVFELPLNVILKKDDTILNFDILTGDMLFVDRLSYHFRYPKIGDPFVFRTDNIRGLNDPDGNRDEKYYIKRLVGKGGDTLEIKEPVLYRNRSPISGVDAFQSNADRVGEYEGYLARGWLSPGQQEILPEGYFYAMGDNSDESHDSRTWIHHHAIQSTDSSGKRKSKQLGINLEKRAGKPVNFVPDKEVVGKAVFIFYPFTKRWGPAQ